MEYIPCPLCKNDRYRLMFKRRDLIHHVTDETFNVVRCRKCSFIYVNPRPTEKEIHSYYPPEFFETCHSRNQVLEEKKSCLEAKLRQVSHLNSGMLLDIGCGKGEFLFLMAQRGWQVRGLEFSSKPPNLFGLDIFCGTLEEMPIQQDCFDLITLWAVLEHVHNPLEMLRRVQSLLKPNGRAIVLIPNFLSVPGIVMRHDDVPRHLNMFTERTFRKMAKMARLQVCKVTFSNEVFSGSVRGILNYLLKLTCGEKIQDIVAQNRNPSRWDEFSSKVKGRPSRLMQRVDAWDIRLSPHLDSVLNKFHLGFIMNIELAPKKYFH